MEGEGDYKRVHPVVEESAACEKTALEMDDLPNEMLKSILEELVVVDPERPYRWSQEFWSSNFRSVIAYRQVRSRWRDFLDEILEKSLLSTVRAWCPPFHHWNSGRTPLSKVPIFYTQTIGLEEDEISCPPSLSGYNGSTPFPGKAVEVGFNYGRRDVVQRTQKTIRLMDLFTKVGHHLSFLYLNNLTIVDLDVLVGILERCQNLKALVVRDLTVSKDKSPRPLPALPQLKTLVIESVQTESTVKSGYRLIPSFNQWLVEPVACQLIQLRNDCDAPVTAPLPNLKQLTLSYPTPSVLQQNGPAVSLLRLCINIKNGYGWNGNVYDVFCYVDRFSKTLVDLFLNDYWSNLVPEPEASDDDAVEDDDQEEEEQQQRQDPFMEELQRVYGKLPTSKVKFPHLKTLAFPFPVKEMHAMLLSQTVLPKFPALEELQLLHFRQTYSTFRRYGGVGEAIAKYLTREDYWTICRKLKKITVIEHEKNGGIILICSRPVFT